MAHIHVTVCEKKFINAQFHRPEFLKVVLLSLMAQKRQRSMMAVGRTVSSTTPFYKFHACDRLKEIFQISGVPKSLKIS